MITSILLENFKCFRKLEVQPRLITVFVGPNGSGKSSVLQAMALLKQSVNHGALYLNGPLVRILADQALEPHFQHDGGRLRLGFGGTYTMTTPRIPGIGEKVEFSYTSEFQGTSLVGHWGSISYWFREQKRTIKVDTPGGSISEALVIGDPQAEYLLARTPAISQSFQLSGGARGPADQATMELLQTQVVVAPRRVLENLKFVLATRGLVRPAYQLGSHRIDDVSVVDGLTQQEEQTATNLAYSRFLEGKLSNWMKKVTGVGLRADVVPQRSVEVKSLAPVGEVNIVGEGFGTNTLILLLWQLASAAGGATVMMEEPEEHLHPRAQAELASLLVDVAKEEKKQIIMTTHSEHILGRLLTLVAEKNLTVDQLAIYAFEKDEQGVCTANQLEVIEDGRVKGDIKDFFEPHLAELERYIRALQAQK